MGFNRFRLAVVLRVLIIVITSFLIVISIASLDLLITSILLIIVLILEVSWLIRYFDRTNRQLNRFVESVKTRDLTSAFNDDSADPAVSELNKSFNEIIESIRNIRIEKENQHHYLNTVVEHVGVGIISFNENGNVELFNDAAKKLLQTPYLINIRSLNRLHEDFYDILMELEADRQKLIKFGLGSELLQLSLRAAFVTLHDKKIKIVSIQNIKAELDAKELDAWQKLIRVLTHEIMNSVSPITSLSSTIVDMYVKKGITVKHEEISDEVLEDTVTGLKTIAKRGKGLLKFVESYRSLTKLPTPRFDKVRVDALFRNIYTLMEENVCKNNIECYTSVNPEELTVIVDEKLIEQVLINLIRNSIHALKGIEHAKIEMRAYVNNNDKTVIEVRDNGAGIPAEIIENIFTPFFTTNEKGSGIGLSLSKQIMQMHRGSIAVNSSENAGAVFFLEF